MLIVDACVFYNELDMLNYRLNVLHKHADYFVVVEATHTYNGLPKPLHFAENRSRFAPFLDRIIHIIVGDFPHKTEVKDGRQWVNENYQREVGVARGLARVPGLTDDDFVVHSDIDEIINPNVLKAVRAGLITAPHNTLEMDMYYYNLTTLLPTWYAPCLLKAGIAKRESLRNKRGNMIPNAGWHLSYFGDATFIRNKIQHFSHQEFNMEKYTCDDNIIRAVKNGTDLFNRGNLQLHRIQVRDNERLPPRLDLLAKYCVEF
jgi:beta-1,4-mannosyl-glycoprotein beta-1,4-N-acetylglucosaminyltransferase